MDSTLRLLGEYGLLQEKIARGDADKSDIIRARMLKSTLDLPGDLEGMIIRSNAIGHVSEALDKVEGTLQGLVRICQQYPHFP